MSARAAASEQLSAQVFDSLTAGLLVVDARGAREDPESCRPAACSPLTAPVGRPSTIRELLARRAAARRRDRGRAGDAGSRSCAAR